MNLLWLGLLLFLAGCATGPRPVASQADAVARAAVTHDLSVETDHRVDLPPAELGYKLTGSYHLFSRWRSSEGLTFGIVVSGTGQVREVIDGTGLIVTGKGLGEFEVRRAGMVVPDSSRGAAMMEARFNRTQLEQGATSGVTMEISSAGGVLAFDIPGWMFMALAEATAKNELHKMVGQESVSGYKSEETVQAERERSRRLYVEATPGLEPDLSAAILDGRLLLGMKADEVRVTRGDPEKIYRTVDGAGIHEQWLYGENYLFFENGLLQSWQESE